MNRPRYGHLSSPMVHLLLEGTMGSPVDIWEYSFRTGVLLVGDSRPSSMSSGRKREC